MALKASRIIENARLMFKNFSGAESEFNAAGDRNFCIALDPEVADEMVAEGWNVKELQPRPGYEEEGPTYYIKVSLSYRFPERAPVIVRFMGENRKHRQNLTERTVSSLDWDEIEKVDLEIRPYNWSKGGRNGVKAYLKSMYVTVKADALGEKYGEYDEPATTAGPADEVPFE